MKRLLLFLLMLIPSLAFCNGPTINGYQTELNPITEEFDMVGGTASALSAGNYNLPTSTFTLYSLTVDGFTSTSGISVSGSGSAESITFNSSGLVIDSTTLYTAGYIVVGSTDGTSAGLLNIAAMIEVPFNFTIQEIRLSFEGATGAAVLSTGTITISTSAVANFPTFGTGKAMAFTNVYSTSTTSMTGISTTYKKGDFIRATGTNVEGAVNVLVTLLGIKQ